jgi:hypothetical protein
MPRRRRPAPHGRRRRAGAPTVREAVAQVVRSQASPTSVRPPCSAAMFQSSRSLSVPSTASRQLAQSKAMSRKVLVHSGKSSSGSNGRGSRSTTRWSAPPVDTRRPSGLRAKSELSSLCSQRFTPSLTATRASRPSEVCRSDSSRPDRLVGEEPPEVLAHHLGRLVPRLGALLDRLQDDRLQVARDPYIEGPGLRRALGLDLLDQLEPVGGA